MNIDPNTEKFWNRKLNDNRNLIISSPIFIHKNNILISFLKNVSGNLLDVGFGYGHLEQLIEKNSLNLQLHGIDISSYAVKFAKDNYRGVYKKANIYNVTYKNNFFDCVLAIDLLEHLPTSKIDVALSEIYRVLKSDGTLLVSVPLNESKKDKLSNGHLRDYNSTLIKDELSKSSFVVTKQIYLSSFKKMYYLKYIINSILKIRKPNLVILVAIKK